MMKPALLFYCQHSLGIGHLTRSFALAAELTERFRVIFLNGGRLPPRLSIPDGVELIHLPPLGMDDGHTLVSRDGATPLLRAQAERRRLILGMLEAARPEVVLVELFPFGRKKFAFELLPLIRAARAVADRPVAVVCSLRDLLVSERRDQQAHDDRARWLADRYFDAVLVHADPALARLEESFRPRRPLAVPVAYTGYVVPRRVAAGVTPREHRVLVSAGGGIVGAGLFHAALAAQPALWQRHGLVMRLVAGPFLPEDEWQALRALAEGRDGLELLRQVPDLAAEMRGAAASVSQCGYNTALDILVSGVPALVVPYAAPGENEQAERARRLAAAGNLRWLPAAGLGGETLGAAIEDLLQFEPRPSDLALAGAQRGAELIFELWRGLGRRPLAGAR